MGTSAAIVVEGLDEVVIYKHFDGDPDSTLTWLKQFNKTFTENRGDDSHYKFAQLLRSSAREAEYYNLDDSIFTGWGVLPKGTINTDYSYLVKLDGTVDWVEGGQENLEPAR